MLKFVVLAAFVVCAFGLPNPEDAQPNGLVRLTSSDGEVFEEEDKVARHFGLIRDMLDAIGDVENQESAIPLPNVHSDTLKLVLEWARQHKDDPIVPENQENEDKRIAPELSEWDKKFLKTDDQSTLFEIILAANYFNARDLLLAGCKTVADMIKGKSPEEIRQLFNIENDFEQTA